MKITERFSLLLSFVCIIFSGCKERNLKDQFQGKAESIIASDTIIGSKPITDEIAGSAYRKRAKSYFVIINNDTSDFRCIFAEAREGGKVSLFLNLPYSKRTISYRQIKKELKLVLPAANKDFNFDSLKSISYGRLVLSGDLAVEVSQEYLRKFGVKSMERPNYRQIYAFLQSSTLVQDVNSIFKPYSIAVKQVSSEKAFFTDKRELYWASKVESDSAKVPDKILDCITYITLKSVN